MTFEESICISVLLWGTAYRVLGQDGITEGSRRHEIPSVDLSLPLAFGRTIAEATERTR